MQWLIRLGKIRWPLGGLMVGAALLSGCGGDSSSVSVNTTDVCAVQGDTVGLHLYLQQMVSFDHTAPGVMRSVCKIRLPGHSDDIPVAMAYRPRDQKLYLLGVRGNLYQLNTQTAEGTWVSQLKADPTDVSNPFVSLPESSQTSIARVAMAFDGQTDRLHLLTADRQSLEVNPDTGATTTLAPLYRVPNTVQYAVAAAAVGPLDHQLYALVDAPDRREVARLNRQTGELTPLALLDAQAVGLRSMGLTFKPDGTALASSEVAVIDSSNTATKAIRLYQLPALPSATSSTGTQIQVTGPFPTELNDLYAIAYRGK